jgi:hypothetical protein
LFRLCLRSDAYLWGVQHSTSSLALCTQRSFICYLQVPSPVSHRISSTYKKLSNRMMLTVCVAKQALVQWLCVPDLQRWLVIVVVSLDLSAGLVYFYQLLNSLIFALMYSSLFFFTSLSSAFLSLSIS